MGLYFDGAGFVFSGSSQSIAQPSDPLSIPFGYTFLLFLNWSLLQNLQIGGGFRYVDSRFANDGNSEELPAYTVFDASINWSVNSNTTVTVRGRNLTDEEDYVLAPYVSNQWIFGDPRAFEISLRYKL